LCRKAPNFLKQAKTDQQSLRQAAMYHCYESLLLQPDQSRGEGVDGNVDDRGDDLQLSEAVYLRNFKQPLNEIISKIVAQHTDGEPLTIIDVGAGSGGMLLDVANSAQLAAKSIYFVAIDPSKIARQACRRIAQENPHISWHVAAGSIESPAEILQSLRAKNIPSKNCIVLAKAALHDRTLSAKRKIKNKGEEKYGEPQNINGACNNYVYRDEDWQQVGKRQVMDDMITVLNAWKQTITNARLIILESHILPIKTINEQIKRIALMPAYLSHSLSAQYLLSANDHLKATQHTWFKKKKFMPLLVMPDQSALMSIALLEE
jgi:hypothetical protein